MLVHLHGTMFRGGFGHGGRGPHLVAGLHLLGTLLMIAATIVFAAAATAGVSEWVQRRYRNEDSTKAAAWVTFLIVFVALGWLTLRVV